MLFSTIWLLFELWLCWSWSEENEWFEMPGGRSGFIIKFTHLYLLGKLMFNRNVCVMAIFNAINLLFGKRRESFLFWQPIMPRYTHGTHAHSSDSHSTQMNLCAVFELLITNYLRDPTRTSMYVYHGPCMCISSGLLPFFLCCYVCSTALVSGERPVSLTHTIEYLWGTIKSPRWFFLKCSGQQTVFTGNEIN